MKPNVGENERYARIAVGCLAALAAVTISKSRGLSAALGAVAASGIETGLSRYCPVNEILGIDNAPSLTETPLSSGSEAQKSSMGYERRKAAII